MTNRRGEPIEEELGGLMAEAMARGQEEDMANLAYEVIPVGKLSRWLWRFIHYRIRRFGP